MSTSYASELLARFESNLADLYDLYAERLASDSEVSSMFSRLAREEQTQVSQIAHEGRMVDADPKAFAGLEIDTDELLMAMAKVKHARDNVPVVTLADALRTAVEFEGEAADYHGRMAVLQANSAIGTFLSHLGGEDSMHRERLAGIVAQRLNAH